MFRCSECACLSPRWAGRCPRCGAWSSLQAAADVSGARAPPARALPLDEIAAKPPRRLPTGNRELDRVLGGGLVPGSALLVGGEPGIGKSTLLLAAAARLEASAIYVAGEESPGQIALRARRLGLQGCSLQVLDSTDTDAVADLIRRERPRVCVVDSVQTLRATDIAGVPGGPAQVRAAADRLVPVTRETGTTLVLVGQVTKVGGIAGPRFLEHAVDTVALFEGDRHLSVRALRVVKNRFGPTDEIGLFEMREDGLHEVHNASELLLKERGGTGPGSVVACVVEGRRALCVEVQALLVGDKRFPARRRAQGLDPRRVELLVGVVESHYAHPVGMRDVFVNVVGGLTVQDRGLDLALAAAVVGSQQQAAVDAGAAVIGEVGLRGEVRSVPRMAARLKEARAMGFRRVFAPPGTPALEGIEVVEVRRVRDVFAQAAPAATALAGGSPAAPQGVARSDDGDGEGGDPSGAQGPRSPPRSNSMRRAPARRGGDRAIAAADV